MRSKLLAAMVCLAACSKQKVDAAPSASLPPVSVPASGPIAVAPNPANPEGGSLGERMGREGANRPAAALKSEDVFASIMQAGVEVRGQKQVLASTIDAAYCQSALTTQDLRLVVCEFASDAAAEHGRQKATTLIAVPNRDAVVRHATLLQVFQLPKSAKSTAAAKKVLDAFNAL